MAWIITYHVGHTVGVCSCRVLHTCLSIANIVTDVSQQNRLYFTNLDLLDVATLDLLNKLNCCQLIVLI